MRKISLLHIYGGLHTLDLLLALPYHKIYLLIESAEVLPKVTSTRLQFLVYTSEREWKKVIKKLVSDHPNELIVPFFRGDSDSQYSIYLQNQYQDITIDRKLFRHKNKMNEFIGQEKKFLYLLQDELATTSYSQLQNTLQEDTMIIKPINRSASAGAFKIASAEDWNRIKNRLLPAHHVAEEYYPWHLHSIDFYFDGEHILILCAVKEMPFIEIMDENKFSPWYLEQYGEEIKQHFLYALPIRYDIDYSRLHDNEWKFIQSLWTKLKAISYQWFIHLEYKFDPLTKKVWFIERGARMGWQRVDWIKRLHYFDMRELLYDIHSNDISKRKAYKWCYIFKNRANDVHYIGIYKNFLKKTHIGTVLSSYKNYFKISFQTFVTEYFKSIGITITNIKTIATTGSNHYFYPSYEWKWSLKILFEVDDENFKKLRKKKIEIIEKLVF